MTPVRTAEPYPELRHRYPLYAHREPLRTPPYGHADSGEAVADPHPAASQQGGQCIGQRSVHPHGGLG